MMGAVFSQVMRRSLWPLLFWGGGAGLVAWAMVIVIPNAEALQLMAKLVETFPPALLKAFGGEDITFFSTPEGYLSMNLFSWLLPVMAVYSILVGLAVSANEEEQGVLDVLISWPIQRWRILLEKVLAYSAIIVTNMVLILAGLWLGVLQTPAMAISNQRMVEGTLNMIPSALIVFAFTVMAATLVRRRNVAAGLATVVLVASYVVDLVGRAAPGTLMDRLRVISFYTYHDNPGVMVNGLAWGNIVGLLLASVLMIGIASWAFERRDVGI